MDPTPSEPPRRDLRLVLALELQGPALDIVRSRATPLFGSGRLFAPEDVPDAVLARERARLVEGEPNDCALHGGYILVSGQAALLHPQCCGDLSDLGWWLAIAKGERVSSDQHPVPDVAFLDDCVRFDCSAEWDEFDPEGPRRFDVLRADLAAAVESILPTVSALHARVAGLVPRVTDAYDPSVLADRLAGAQNRPRNLQTSSEALK